MAKRSAEIDTLQTVAESSDYARTSTHRDVLAFLNHLEPQSERLKIGSMGRSGEGQDMPVVILSAKKGFTPAAAKKLGLPVVLVIANIHAGEVEGKEACLMLARDITTGKLGRLMEKATILLVPNYNPDGNDKIDRKNRLLDLKALEGQVGPEGGVGTRYTGKGINLNRDYMKMEAVESRHLSKLVGEWTPHVIVDCHTTDGSVHGYDLTFDTSHTVESGAKELIVHTRDTILPAISKSLRKRTGTRTFFYGNFRDHDDPTKGWETYPGLPRYGSHYRGLINCVDILLETYSYIDFHSRCDVIYAFLQEILQYAGDHGDEIVRRVETAREDVVERGRSPKPDDFVGVNYGVPTRGPKGELVVEYPVHPLYEFEAEAWDLESQKAHRVPGKSRKTYPTMFYGRFVPTASVRRPLGYVIPASESRVVAQLRLHNIEVEELGKGREFAVEQYVVLEKEATHSPDVGSMKRSETVFWMKPERATLAAKAGDFRVGMDQPLANLAIYLLEPQSDDGLVRWNFFDRLGAGDVYPVRRIAP